MRTFVVKASTGSSRSNEFTSPRVLALLGGTPSALLTYRDEQEFGMKQGRDDQNHVSWF